MGANPFLMQNLLICIGIKLKFATVKKRRNHTTIWDKLLNRLGRISSVYTIFLLFLLVSFPSSVIDGMRNLEENRINLRLPVKYNTHGIDISHHNGVIDWEKVNSFNEHPAAVNFCFAKATEGSDLVDPEFERNWLEMRQKGIRRGAYHFFNLKSDPRLQALNYILNVKLSKGDLAPVLDWETTTRGKSKKAIIKNAKIWLDIVEKHYGIKPIIYTNKHIYNDYIKEHFADYPLWISHYEVPELVGYDLSKVYFWQHSMKGQVEGIESLVDFNVFIRDDYEIERITLRQ
jgi:lysozyme